MLFGLASKQFVKRLVGRQVLGGEQEKYLGKPEISDLYESIPRKSNSPARAARGGSAAMQSNPCTGYMQKLSDACLLLKPNNTLNICTWYKSHQAIQQVRSLKQEHSGITTKKLTATAPKKASPEATHASPSLYLSSYVYIYMNMHGRAKERKIHIYIYIYIYTVYV